jgi:hypothetical protein
MNRSREAGMTPARPVRALGIAGWAALVILATAPVGAASYGVTDHAGSPALRADAQGDAEVTWTEGGVRRSFVVPRAGPGHNGALSGRDVSRPSRAAVPLALVVRATQDGTLWAVQQLNVTGRPASLDFSRWHGAPTQLTLSTDGKRLQGSVTFQGKPVTGTSSTPAGRPVRIYVFIECFGCPGRRSGWSLMLGVPPKANGSFSIYLRSSWVGSKYRATVTGPNVGGTLAPDAQVTISA